MIQKFAKMMEDIDVKDHDSSAYKLKSDFNTNDVHHKSI